MSSKTNLLMFTATSLLAPVALEGAAEAGKPTTAVMVPRAVEDTAPTANGRLRRTNEEQPGNEMSTFALAGDGKSGYYFSMTTELPPTTAGGPVRRATDRMQLSMTPFVLEQTPDGSVIAKSDPSKSMFVTNNDGNEYRNANHPYAFALDANNMCVEYNYQANNTNDTKRYIQCFNSTTGAKTLEQKQIFAKNNDDASMNQSGAPLVVTQKIGNKFQVVAWRGANGNGRDDGWLQSYSLTVNGGVYTVKGSGDDIYYTKDKFHFASQTMTGDGEIVARMLSQTYSKDWAKAGLMFREALTDTSRHASVLLTPGHGDRFTYRLTTGGASAETGSGNPANWVPRWLRLVRSGRRLS